jgi:integrase
VPNGVSADARQLLDAGEQLAGRELKLARRVLAPACTAAGVRWAGFHTFRHTVASRLFAKGRNVVQVQRWLGHHSPSFTLDTYVHLLDNDLGEPLHGAGWTT